MRQKPSFKFALVTGATSGLGKAMATFLQKKGIEVIGVGSSDYDLSTKTGREGLCKLISEKKPDLIINNAGLGLYGPAIKHPLEKQLEIVEVNVTALTALTIHGAKTLIDAKKEGTILNISSAAAFFPFPTFSIYAASKSYVNAFSQSMDMELKSSGIRVLCACPGQIETDFRRRSGLGYPQKPDRRTMRVEKAVSLLWSQIEEQKPLFIFGLRTKILLLLSKLFSRNRLGSFLKRSISDRYQH